MPALATLEELREVERQIDDFKRQYPDAGGAVVALLKRNRRIGYKNICKLLTGEATPEKLKGTASA